MKIQFDNQIIEYNISLSYNDDAVKIDITYPQSFTLKNEERLKALEEAILQDHDVAIQLMIKVVAKDGQAKQKVNCIFKAPMFFDSLTLANRDSFFFYNGIKLDSDSKINIANQQVPGLEESIHAGNPFSYTTN